MPVLYYGLFYPRLFAAVLLCPKCYKTINYYCVYLKIKCFGVVMIFAV